MERNTDTQSVPLNTTLLVLKVNSWEKLCNTSQTSEKEDTVESTNKPASFTAHSFRQHGAIAHLPEDDNPTVGVFGLL